jgi:hypothetical protein
VCSIFWYESGEKLSQRPVQFEWIHQIHNLTPLVSVVCLHLVIICCHKNLWCDQLDFSRKFPRNTVDLIINFIGFNFCLFKISYQSFSLKRFFQRQKTKLRNFSTLVIRIS